MLVELSMRVLLEGVPHRHKSARTPAVPGYLAFFLLTCTFHTVQILLH